MDKSGADKLERLQRQLEREKAAREEAEQLLETKSSELFNASEGLRAEAERTRSLIEATAAAADGIALTDAEGFFTYMNNAHAELFGYTPEELIGKSWSVLYTNDVAKRIGEVAMPVVMERGSWRGEAIGLSKSGHVVDQDVALTARPNGEGLICVTRDASGRKQRETKMRELEHRLRQGEKSAAVYLLSNTIAHDLGNLIAVIEGNTNTDGLSLSPDEMVQRMKRISAATESARSVMESIETGIGSDMRTEHTVDLAALMHKNLDLITSIKPDAVTVKAELAQNAQTKVNDILLARSILNISKNAFEVMEGGGTLTIRLISGADYEARPASLTLGTPCDDPAWVIDIEDTGPGFPAIDLENYFEPFASTKTKTTVAGLGLLSVRALAESRSATVEVYTRVGHGTVFRILIPEAAESFVRTQVRVEAQNTVKILVVEDEIAIGEQLASILRSDGYDVSFLSSAPLARDVLLGGSQVDLVVTDLNMPDLTGDALARQVLAERPDLPFILVSSGAKYVVESGLFASRIRKPIDGDALKAAVHNALG